MDLEAEIMGIRLRNPLMNASGVLGSRKELLRRLAESGLGAIVSKTITPEPRAGYEPPIIIALPTGGVLNAVGLANPGMHALGDLLSEVKGIETPVIVSVGGRKPEEYARVAAKAEEAGADAVELNLSCPHTEGYGSDAASDESMARRIVSAAASTLSIPVSAKLGWNPRLVSMVNAALDAGARAVTLINVIKGMYIDVYTGRPVLTHGIGGLGGPPIHPVAVASVYMAYGETGADIIGVGGVYDWRTAAELILAGAKAVGIASSMLGREKHLVQEILGGLAGWLEDTGISSIREAVGLAHRR
jgi:dihydroorotate dehydrogenase (NAD+) catalytic subunit